MLLAMRREKAELVNKCCRGKPESRFGVQRQKPENAEQKP